MQVMCFLPENVKYAFCSKSYAEINWQNALPINVFFYIKIKHFFCIYKGHFANTAQTQCNVRNVQ